MSKTKVEFVNRAYKWIRISGLTTTAIPEEIEDALETLENMMLEFHSRNICSKYVFEDNPLPNTDTQVEPEFNNAIETNLAVRIIIFFGKPTPVELGKQATQSLSNWSSRSGRVNQIIPPRRMPRGSGNTFRFSNWIRFDRQESNAPISCDTEDLKVDEINNFTFDFNEYLIDTETISSFTIDTSDGIELLSSSESGGVVSYSCKGIKGKSEVVQIVVTTSTGRVNPETINFNITLV